MSTLVDTVKEFSKGSVENSTPWEKKDGRRMSPGSRIKDSYKSGKKVVTEAQRFDPGSKYLGVSGVPGVDSRKTINRESDDAESDAAENARITAEKYAREHPAPVFDDQAEDLAQKRKTARRRASSGRISTVLSDSGGTLG